MQEIYTLVRNLAVILLLASFLEMLLPGKSMRGFVKLIMGLFVISAVLNPVTKLLHIPLSMDIPAWSQSDVRDMPVLAGNSSANYSKDAVKEQYKSILTHQIEALLLGMDIDQKTSVEIEFEETGEGIMDQPNISSIKITLSPDDGVIQPVKPIIIGGEAEKNQAQISELAEEVRDKIAAFLQLPKAKIFVMEN